MVVMSLLRPALGHSARATLFRGAVSACKKQVSSPPIGAGNVIRRMGGHSMVIRPSRLEWERWKNDLHFYFMLGLGPMAILIAWCNIYIGHAELADIPPNCEIMPHEYHKGPIQRFFARYVYEYPELVHERTMHCLYVEQERRKIRALKKKVKLLMHDRQDYKGWYFSPLSKQRIETSRYYYKLTKDEYTGTSLP